MDEVRVPREPTEAMAYAGARALIEGQDSRPGASWAQEAAHAYRAMLAAAPQQPAAQPGAADAGKPSGPTAITAAAGPATNGVFCSVDEPQQPAVQPEPMARFCPGCGSVGPVPEKYRDCCPDGDKARMIPEALARHCRDLFQLALSAPGDALHPQQPAAQPASAIDTAEVLRLAKIAIDDAVESALFGVGYYELEGDANAHRKAASAKAAESRAALCRALAKEGQ